ncbi:hypothetical protein GCM10028864_18300 [Microlunatus parietis]
MDRHSSGPADEDRAWPLDPLMHVDRPAQLPSDALLFLLAWSFRRRRRRVVPTEPPADRNGRD